MDRSSRSDSSRSPLTSVAVVCRSVEPRIDAISALVWSIDAFVGVAAHWDVPKACAEAPGALRVLPRIAAMEPRDMHPLMKRKLFADAMVQAVGRGDLAIVQWLVEEYLPTGRVRQAIDKAAARGRLDILKWLHENHTSRVVWGHKELHLAAKGDHFETVKWLFGHSERLSADDKNALLFYAMGNGNVAMVEWLCELDLPYMEPRMWSAAWNGHLAVIQWVSLHFGCPCPQSCMDAAVSGGHLNLAQWLRIYASLRSTDVSSVIEAARFGHLKMIKWVFENLVVDDMSGKLGAAIDGAAAGGHLETLKFLHQHSHHCHLHTQCSINAMDAAASAGHIETVKYLHDECRAPCSTEAMDGAARGGHFAVVKWLHEHRKEGCTTRAMDYAASIGHFEMLKWLHENRAEGCTSHAMDMAAEGNRLDIVQFLHENRREGCTKSAMNGAAALGHLDVVQWLHDNRNEGCSSEAMDRGAASGHLDVVKWLHTNRSEGCTVRAMNGAAKYGHLAVVQWLHANRSEGCTGDAICYAANFGRLATVQWLLANRPEQFRVGAMNYAILGGHFDVVLALHKDGRSECTPESFRVALRGQEYEILQFLLREYGHDFPGLAEYFGGRVGVYVRDCINELSQL